MPVLKTVALRLREKTTWAGIVILLGLFGVPAPIVTALGGVLDVAPQVIDAVAGIANAAVIGGGAAVAIATAETGGP